MRAWLAAIPMVLSFSLAAHGQTTGEECAKIDDSAKRMVCYDSVFRTKAATPVVEGEAGKWSIRSEQSRITDKTDVFVSLQSDQVVPDRFGGAGRPAVLNLRCQDDTTSLTVWFGGQFMASSGGFDQVTYRIDTREAVGDRWDVSTNNEHLGLWSGGQSIPLIKSLFGAENLLVQAAPFNENKVVLDFKVGGIENAVKPLREACGW